MTCTLKKLWKKKRVRLRIHFIYFRQSLGPTPNGLQRHILWESTMEGFWTQFSKQSRAKGYLVKFYNIVFRSPSIKIVIFLLYPTNRSISSNPLTFKPTYCIFIIQIDILVGTWTTATKMKNFNISTSYHMLENY